MSGLPYERRNFNLLVGDVASFMIALAFIDAATVFPVLVQRLGGDSTLIGTLLALKQAMIFLPTIWAGHQLQGRVHYLQFLLRVALFGRLGLFLAAWLVYHYGRSAPSIALFGFAACYVVLWLSDGMGIVPWMAIVSRVVPTHRRGRLFASTTIASALVKLGAGFLVTFLLSGKVLPFPDFGAVLLLCSGVWMVISFGFLAGLKELAPETPPPPTPRHSLQDYLKRLPQLLRERRDLRLLATAQVLGTSVGASIPFLVGFTGRGEELAGSFLNIQTVGLLLFAPLWGYLTDRFGPKFAICGLFAIELLAPLCALSGLLPLYFVAYFCYGAVLDAWSCFTNYLLEAIQTGDSGSADETTYIAVMNVANAPSLLLPFVMGLIAQRLGAPTAFGVTLVLITFSLGIALRLPNTRR